MRMVDRAALFLCWLCFVSPTCAIEAYFLAVPSLVGVAGLPGDASPEDAAVDSEPTIKPRLQLKLKSLCDFSAAIDRSSLAPLAYHFAEVASEANSRASEGIEHDQLEAMFEQVISWPETPAEIAIFAPDSEGRPRWGARVQLPVGRVHDLLLAMIEDERLTDFFEGVEVRAAGGRFVVGIPDQDLLHLKAEGTASTVIASHVDLPMSAEFFSGSAGEIDPLIAARLTFDSTEKDSGGTFFSQLKLIQSVDYTLRSQENGNWLGEFRVNWPPMLGMAAKPFVGRAKQSFFVPQEAFLGAVMRITSTRVVLDQVVGFDEDQGILAAHAGDELCVTVLPGSGFMPVPDVVLQCRVSDVESLVESTEEEVASANKRSRKRDEKPRWHETTVRSHKVFWSEQPLEGKALIPFTLRPVFFVQRAEDAKARERDFLIIGLTSTNPEEFVERWLDLPRNDQPRHLPSERGLNGEVWVHWKQLYEWIVPYINVGLSGASSEFVIGDQLGERLEDARIAIRLKYEGLRIEHDGPVPLGVLSLPSMIGASMQEATGTDLARERIAARRLRVLHHHSQLFYQDIGRWPSQVAELDGYIDFAGNEYLLELRSSPKKRWSEFMEDFFDFDADDEEDEEEGDEEADELYAEIDDSLYVIAWIDDQWTLGFEEDKFDHLEQLYIDEFGKIHRVEKVVKASDGDQQKKLTDQATGDAKEHRETNQDETPDAEPAEVAVSDDGN